MGIIFFVSPALSVIIKTNFLLSSAMNRKIIFDTNILEIHTCLRPRLCCFNFPQCLPHPGHVVLAALAGITQCDLFEDQVAADPIFK